jgi:hypothetical protein
MKLPPRDSWIALKAGEKVVVDPKLRKQWREETENYRRIRGTILAAAFEIEYILDQLLVEILLPSPDSSKDKSQWEHPVLGVKLDDLRYIFDQHFLKSAPIRFARKIRIFKKSVSQLPNLAKITPDQLLNRLNRSSDLRNRFAHYPITFTIIGQFPNQTLLANLVCSDKEITLDKVFLTETQALFDVTGDSWTRLE